MSWSTLPPDLRELAERKCTPAQLEALKLWDADAGYGSVGVMLRISKDSARDRIRRAITKLVRAAADEGLEWRPPPL